MQHPYINKRLCDWADWVIRGKNAGRNGYPKQAAFTCLMPKSDTSAWCPALDVEADEIEQCVVRLSAERRRAVQVFYLRTGTVATAARACGCCPKTLFNRIAAAQQDILGMLNDIAVGLPLPAVELAAAA